jgi:hypothetical protein
MGMSSAPDIRRRPHRAIWHPAADDLGNGHAFSRRDVFAAIKIFKYLIFLFFFDGLC